MMFKFRSFNKQARTNMYKLLTLAFSAFLLLACTLLNSNLTLATSKCTPQGIWRTSLLSLVESMTQPPNAGGDPQPPPPSKTELLDAPLHTFGFEFDELSAKKVSGHLLITAKCCQPFKVLHGGMSALMAEAVASVGAHIASGFKRVAGMQLSINHLKPAREGDLVVAEATPVSVGKSIQVWDVRLSKCEPSKSELKILIASSRVTILCNLSVPESAKDAPENFKRYAKL